jgi:A nuclease family of the HNH/ENDO VII superfamily with conserved AHH
MIKKIIKPVALLTIMVSLIVISCQTDDLTTIKEQEIVPKSLYKQKTVSLAEIPNIEQKVIEKTNPDVFNRTEGTNSNQAIFETENILEIIDTLNNANYSIQFRFPDTPISTFYNLVVGETPNGEVLTPFVMRYVCDDTYLDQYIESGFDINYFVGKMAMHKYTDFFALGEFDRVETQCPPQFDDFGDPISCVEEPFNGGSGGGSTSGPNGDGNPDGGDDGGGSGSGSGQSCFVVAWQCVHRNELHAQPSDCNEPEHGGTWVLNQVNCSSQNQNTAPAPDSETGRTVEYDCPDCTTPEGGVGVNPISLATMSATLKHNLDLSFDGIEFVSNSNNAAAIKLVYDYLINGMDPSTNSYTNSAKVISEETIKFYLENLTEDYSLEPEALLAADISLSLNLADIITNFYSEEYENVLVLKLSSYNSGLVPLLMQYQSHVIAEMFSIMATEYEDGHVFTYWEVFKIAVRAQKETIHFGLDVAGMAPGIGIVFDVTNAAIYAVSMDWGNATLSLGSAIPIAGQWVTASKWAKKVVVLSNSRKVYLKVYNLADGTVKFSNRNQLRKILEITDSTIHAHHIIPFGLVSDLTNPKAWGLIQSAAKSNNVWHINDIYNGIPMPKSLHLSGHSAYTNRIIERMNAIYDGLPSPDSYDDAYNGLMNLCNELKLLIQQNPNLTSGQLAILF